MLPARPFGAEISRRQAAGLDVHGRYLARRAFRAPDEPRLTGARRLESFVNPRARDALLQRDILLSRPRRLITLGNGVELSALGFGVFQSPPGETVGAVETAIATGYRSDPESIDPKSYTFTIAD